jgi:putative endonuclease
MRPGKHNLPTDTGRQAEQLACRFLQQHGLELVTRNYHCRLGEIDLIMRDSTSLVFVEVRFRRSCRYGSPAETVTRSKQQRLVNTARHYLARHPALQQLASRFDVISMTADGPEPQIQWIPDAFYCG